ncbi:hypothetical protein AAF712_006341 [Marasmius tenuissimus]|uniref:Major facilitator superfamily (MFS) profile domain-containing protein n=1 Tax=Marasmius tenuissimus TaxID=585030 RepID=A0ABR2ZZR0_9AGAR
MSTTVITTPADYGQNLNGTGLRGRRFSVNPPLPQNLFASGRADSDESPSSQNESAIEEEDAQVQPAPLSIDLPPNDFARAIPSLPAPMSNAHISSYSTNVYIPRHQNGSGTLQGPISGPPTPYVATPASEFPPSTPVDRSGSIIHLIGGEPIPSPPPNQERVKRRLACAYFLFFLCGWGDGVTGTVLPYLKEYFNLSDILISTLWLGGTIGFFMGTFAVEPVMHSLGLYRISGAANRSLRPAWSQKDDQSRYLTLLLGCFVHSSFFVLMGSRSGFAAMFVAYATAALARAFWTASLNEFLASGPKAAMGYAYGLWGKFDSDSETHWSLIIYSGIGGVFAPLVCQTIIASGAPWQNFYYGSLVVAGINMLLVMYAFKPTQRELFTERKEALSNASPSIGSWNASSRRDSDDGVFSIRVVATSLRRRCSLKHLQNPKISADPKTVGYVTSGYAGGLSVGRLLWGYFSPKMSFTQQKHALTAFCLNSLTGIGLVMHITIWLVDSSLQNSVATAIIGLVYGPIWPGALTIISALLPKDMRMMVMAIFSAAGNLGSSIFPLVIGAMSGAKGIESMPYLAVPLAVSFLALWAIFPSKVPTRSSPN